MDHTWLAFFAPPRGFQGTYLVEARQTCITDTSTMLLCFGNAAKRRVLKQLGIATHQKENTISLSRWAGAVVAECNVSNVPTLQKIRAEPLPSHSQLHHLATTTPESIFSRLVRPFMSVILFFVDDFGSTDEAARMLARWVRISMNDSALASPCLLVIQDASKVSSRDFCWRVNIELLQLLRKSSPDRPYSISEIIRLRKECFGSVHMLQTEGLREHLLSFIDKARDARLAEPLPEFHDTFALVLAHLREHPDAPFDLFAALDGRNCIPNCSRYYIAQYLKFARRSGIDPVPHLAVCLVLDSHLSRFRNPPEDLFIRRYRPIFQEVRGSVQPELIHRLRQEFCRIIRHGQIVGESIVQIHRNALSGAQVSTDVWLCFSCLLRPPIHVLSCQHRLCNHCTILHGSREVGMIYNLRQCPFCKEPNRRLVYLQPPSGRARVLVLENLSVLSAVCLLRDIRSRLFGPLHEYLDLVLGCNKGGRSVVKDVFIKGLSTQECLEKQASRKRLGLSTPSCVQPKGLRVGDSLPGSFQVALWKENELLSSWGGAPKWRDTYNLPVRDIPARISRDFWSEVQVLGFGQYKEPALIAGKLIASLFYAEIVLKRDRQQSCYELNLQCRLEPGPHLASVVKSLLEAGVLMHYQIRKADYISVPLCHEATWTRCKTGQAFGRAVKLAELGDDAEVQIQIDSPTQMGMREHISNSPCIAERIICQSGVVAISTAGSPRASAVLTPVAQSVGSATTTSSHTSDSKSTTSKTEEGRATIPVEECIRSVEAGTDADSEECLSGITELSSEANHSRIFHEIDQLQEMLIEIKRRNRVIIETA